MNSVMLNGAPVTPSKVVCVGRNYVEHIKELDNEMPTEAVIFIKPNSAIADVIDSGKAEEIHYEGELCFLINNKNISAIGFGLDLTKRQLQSTLKAKGLPWERAKAFNNSAVFSEFVTCNNDISDYRMELYINDALIQFANEDLMIHKPESLVKEIEQSFALEDGDIVMTGTPKGVGVVKSGDVFRANVFINNTLAIEQSWVAQ